MNIREDDISFAFGSFETGGKLERLYPRFLSKETGDQEWAYLILKPANYLQPRTADVWSYTQKIRNEFRTR
jgi:hypothetical protein